MPNNNRMTEAGVNIAWYLKRNGFYSKEGWFTRPETLERFRMDYVYTWEKSYGAFISENFLFLKSFCFENVLFSSKSFIDAPAFPMKIAFRDLSTIPKN